MIIFVLQSMNINKLVANLLVSPPKLGIIKAKTIGGIYRYSRF
ncbi:hypothetical protein MC7420_7274 [Coleofasciculus chthonoplastes PCC 7420]|uniref:Uncharacterized protein n=1 Tax=Coleofasciculus chthonoplastes PCC 7420 TaxID=118168 RepID=B4VI44_9CYAN|nr:hypothetical protein MC7420_7274 [Coleofasciculus chthonoplastes PCC 7420]